MRPSLADWLGAGLLVLVLVVLTALVVVSTL
jgi:hypothetical protein